MSRIAELRTDQPSVPAEITYALHTGDKPVNETFETGQIIRRRTGATETKLTHIRDGRPLKGELSLDSNGFELVDHPTAVADFFDPGQLKTVYYPEVERLVREVSGASRVVVFDHTLRTGDSAEQEQRKIREPVFWAHNDYTEWSGPQRVRDFFGAEADQLLAHRVAIIQVWRAIKDPIQRNPLAMVDARSVSPADFVRAERRYPNRVGETYQLSYNANQRWFYFPRMRRDEAIVFKVYDSLNDGRARFTPHTSFEDPTSPADAPPRQSIEVRTFAFFDPAARA
jgi:hypothetical protein